MGRPGYYPGRCKDCARKARKGRSRCKECEAQHRLRSAARRKAFRKALRCVKCGKPVAPSKRVGTGHPGEHRRVREAASCCARCLAYYADRARAAAA